MVAPSASRLRILLVEDDPADVLLTREYLEDSGLENRFEHVGTLGEAAAVIGTPGCVLLDLNLPDGNGLTALGRILKRWPDTAVVVLTGLDDTAMGSAAVAAGAQDYLVKGKVDGDLLGRAIQYAVQRRQAQTTERQLRETRLQTSESLRLQRGLLPKPLISNPQLVVTSRYIPGHQRSLLGGDFFDLVEDSAGAVHAIIGDVCGSGPDEAAIGVGLRVGWRTLTLAGVGKTDRMRLLEQVLVAERPHDAMFATACTVRISADRSQAVFVSAGHPAPLILTAGGARPAPVRSGLALGMFPGRGRWQETTISLPPGAGLLLYTDGAYEGFASDGTRLGEERFVEVASRLTSIRDPAEYLNAVLTEVQGHDNGRHSDDTALLYVA